MRCNRALAWIVTAAATSLALASPPDRPVPSEECQEPLASPPSYRARQAVSGVIRVFGSGLAGLTEAWEAGFREIHPDVTFQNTLPSSDAAIGALVSGVADLAPDGGEAALTETLAFYETYGYHVTDVTVATGAYDVEGCSCGPVVYVNKDNPISRLTMKELDGIFGDQRTAAFKGFKWTLSAGRGSEANIRTWGQLGLTGEWADKPIQTYGHAPSGTTRFFRLKVLANSDKWNPNYRQYVETGGKMIDDEDHDQVGGTQHMLQELSGDPYGIAWTIAPQARSVSGVKAVALDCGDGLYVAPSTNSFRDRSYPLARSIYIYLNRQPGQPVEAKLREFLKFVLSRQGQQIVADDGHYLPLPPETVREQLRKLD